MENERVEVQNAKLVGLQENSFSKEPELVFSIEDALDPEQTLERTIRLWVTEKRDGPISEKAVESTERALRRAFQNEEIEFNWPFDESNENDLSNWVKRNKGAALHGITQRDAYYNLPSSSGASMYGNAKRRTSTDPAKGTYNPQTERVSVVNAMPDAMLQAFKNNGTHPNVKANRKGKVNAYLNDQIIDEVAFTIANQYQTSHDQTTRLEFLDEVLRYFAVVKKAQPGKLTEEAVQEFRDKVEADPDAHGYREMISMFGGANLPNLPKEVASAASTMLANGTRLTLSLFVLNPENGYIYKLSDMKAIGDFSTFEPNFLEFFAGDMAYKDITTFVSNLNLPDYQTKAVEAMNEVLDGNIKNLTDAEFGNPADTVLEFLRHILVGRTIAVRVPAPTGKDYDKIGSYLQSIGLQSESNAQVLKSLYAGEMQVAAPPVEISDEDLPFAEKAKPEADDEAEENEDTESTDDVAETKDEKEEKAPSTNPFLVDDSDASNLFNQNNPFSI